MLDLGCGRGFLGRWLFANGRRVAYTAMDYCRPALESVRRSVPGADVVWGDVNSTWDGSYEAIFAIESIVGRRRRARRTAARRIGARRPHRDLDIVVGCVARRPHRYDRRFTSKCRVRRGKRRFCRGTFRGRRAALCGIDDRTPERSMGSRTHDLRSRSDPGGTSRRHVPLRSASRRRAHLRSEPSFTRISHEMNRRAFVLGTSLAGLVACSRSTSDRLELSIVAVSQELDAYAAANLESAELSWTYADGLAGADPSAPEAGSLCVRPAVRSMAGGTASYAYELRGGLRWHDGKPLVAQDVADCFKRRARGAVGSSASLLVSRSNRRSRRPALHRDAEPRRPAFPIRLLYSVRFAGFTADSRRPGTDRNRAFSLERPVARCMDVRTLGWLAARNAGSAAYAPFVSRRRPNARSDVVERRNGCRALRHGKLSVRTRDSVLPAPVGRCVRDPQCDRLAR